MTSEVREIKAELNIKNKQIEELNELLKAANVIINKLSDRITTLEEKARQDLQNQGELSRRNQDDEDRTLLLGDTNLIHVKASDLRRNCLVRTIKGGNYDLISSWVAERLNWKPSNCVLVCGTHDVLEGGSSINILDSLGSLVAQLKQINEDMVIYICQIGPTLKTDALGEKLVHFNEQLENWCKENGVILIKTFLAFKLGTGEVDNSCYDVSEEYSGVFLNRVGVIRLLSTIAKSCEQFCLREDWNESKLLTEGYCEKDNFLKNRHQTNGRNGNIRVQNNGGKRQSLHVHRGLEKERYHIGREGYSINSNILHSNKDAIETVRNVFNNEKGRGCFNCGELNHRASTCRFDHRLRCGSCDGLGHKRRLCHIFNR